MATCFARRETRRLRSAWRNTSLTLGVEKKSIQTIETSNPHFSHLLVTKRRKGRSDKARDPQAGTPGHRRRTRAVRRGGRPSATPSGRMILAL